MANTLGSHAHRNPAAVLVWGSWACAVYFLMGLGVLRGVIRVPEQIAVFFLLSGAVVAVGALLGLVFLVLARSRAALANGIAAFIANLGLFALFMAALPG